MAKTTKTEPIVEEDPCVWTYKPSEEPPIMHWARMSCVPYTICMTDLQGQKPTKSLAETYNGRICPQCGRKIRINFDLFTKKS